MDLPVQITKTANIQPDVVILVTVTEVEDALGLGIDLSGIDLCEQPVQRPRGNQLRRRGTTARLVSNCSVERSDSDGSQSDDDDSASGTDATSTTGEALIPL